MKKTLLFLSLLAFASAANAQTALYKKYAHREDIRVYCVEHYPLVGGDTVTVTLLEADNDSVRNTIRYEIQSNDFLLRTRKSHKPDTRLNSINEEYQMIDKQIRENKHVVVFLSSPLSGDGGQYYVNCPSDRPVILVFHVYSEEQQASVTRHIMSTEFNTQK